MNASTFYLIGYCFLSQGEKAKASSEIPKFRRRRSLATMLNVVILWALVFFRQHDKAIWREILLNKATIITTFLVFTLLSMTMLPHIGDGAPAENKVKPIEPAELDRIISDKGFKGLVVFMASWCPPCRKELPIIEKLHLKYREKGVQIVAVSVDHEGPKAVQPLVNELKITFPVYWVGIKAVEHYQIAGIPTTMVYDKGRQTSKLPGSFPKKIIERMIKSVLPD